MGFESLLKELLPSKRVFLLAALILASPMTAAPSLGSFPPLKELPFKKRAQGCVLKLKKRQKTTLPLF